MISPFARARPWILAAWLIGVAPPGTAETTPDESPPPSQFDFELGWDAGPTYHVARRIPESLQGLPLPELRRFEIDGRIGGSVFLDGGLRRGDISSRGWTGKVRRARIETRGTLHYGVNTEYKVAFGFESGDFYLNDFYVQWRFDRGFNRLRVGYFDPPVSLEALAGSSDRSLMEVGSPVGAFAPGSRLGVQLDGLFSDAAVTWALNVSSVGQSQSFADSSDSPLRGSARVAWRPFGDDGTAANRLLHLGASWSYTFSGVGEIRYRARPESYLMPYLVDTGDLEGDANLLGLEAAWREGPLTVQGEILRSGVSRDGDASVRLAGAYLQIAYVITGETRPYDTTQSIFERIVPENQFEFSLAQPGAVEIAARYSWLDLDDGDVAGGVLRSLNVGVVWTLNAWVRVEVGYVVSRTRENANEGTSRVLQSRLDFRF